MITILVACGSGVATSTLAADEVKSVCADAEYGIANFKINKCSMSELASEMQSADVVLTTNNYKGDIGKPHMSVAGFITGINEAALRKKLGELLSEISKG
ncbi:PTS sugar transporter subunit IIB [Salmonella enterica subsp. enterica serovar Infantis]|nr:PTS sugar transporter subunit IIB [Salmonella enterica subsp. enterica serovar Infantis]